MVGFGSVSTSLESLSGVVAGQLHQLLNQGIDHAIIQTIVAILVLVKSLGRVLLSRRHFEDGNRDSKALLPAPLRECYGVMLIYHTSRRAMSFLSEFVHSGAKVAAQVKGPASSVWHT